MTVSDEPFEFELTRLGSSVHPDKQAEAAAGSLVRDLLRESQGGHGERAESIARTLWEKHAATVWATLGLYRHYLDTGRHVSAVLCEHILRSRFKEMDADQGHFYRYCIPLLQKAQSQLGLPSPDEEKFARAQVPRNPATDASVAGDMLKNISRGKKPRTLEICKPESLKRLIEAEHEAENRKRLEGMQPITKQKVLSNVSAEALAGVERLIEEQPNMTAALDLILGELRARFLSHAPIRLPPLLLCGGPGTGKTRLVSEIAGLMGLPCREIPLAGCCDAIKITGLSRYWSTAGSGLIARTLCDNVVANPIFIFDEIDKAGSSDKGNPHDAMLMLLEENTARTFRDEFLQCPIDASHASFLATANSVDMLPAPLLSRFIVIEVPPLSHADRIKVTRGIYRQLRKSEPYGAFFAEPLGDGVAETLARDEAMTPRQIRQQMRLAMQRACQPLKDVPQKASLAVELENLPKSFAGTRGRMGFVT